MRTVTVSDMVTRVLRGPNQLSGFAGLICMARETHTTDDAMSPRL